MNNQQMTLKLKTAFPVVLLIISILGTACQSSKSGRLTKEIPFKDNTTIYTKWDDAFVQHTIIPLSFDNPGEAIYTIRDLSIFPDGGYLIMDGKGKRMVQFNAQGHFVRFIASEGAGPGELAMGIGRGFFDKAKNLYLFDIITKRIHKYSYPNYNYEKTFILPYPSQKTIVAPDGNFIIYTVSEPTILQKLNLLCKPIKKTMQVNDMNFRSFSSRFQLGRLAEIPGEGLIISYPQEYKVYFYDYDLNLKHEYYPVTHSRYFPKKDYLPNSLSHNGFSPAHAQWWGQSLRTSRIFYAGNRIFIQSLVEFNNMNTKEYLNIHDLSGNTYAVGVEVPFHEEGFFLHAENGYVYVVEDSVFDDEGNMTVTRLHRYKLKDAIFASQKSL